MKDTSGKKGFGTPRPLSPILARVILPVRRFQQAEHVSGAILLISAFFAVAWANSPLRESYYALWQTPVAVQFGPATLSKPLMLWINDGLMAVFFFVVGLEIKRELLAGDLSSPKRAALPLVAAAGGMLAPAALYTVVASELGGGEQAVSGWGIPTATDIAFALGVLALLGRRIPLSAKVFLTALAIADDIGATLLIAFFYSGELALDWLLVAGGIVGVMFAANWLGVRSAGIYAALGLSLWLAMLESGLHPTLAGILAAFAIPAFRRLDEGAFLRTTRRLLDDFASENERAGFEDGFANQRQQGQLALIGRTAERAQTPLQRLENSLHPWVAFGVMPIFALANAGVELPRSFGEAGRLLADPVALGVCAGLVIGKPLGIVAATWLAVRTRLARLPRGLTWTRIAGLGCLGGIGFTMSLFVTSLAFGAGHGSGQGLGHLGAAHAGTQAYTAHGGRPAEASAAKLGVLTGSVISGVLGYVILRRRPVARSSSG